jgi:hypothetical protein
MSLSKPKTQHLSRVLQQHKPTKQKRCEKHTQEKETTTGAKEAMWTDNNGRVAVRRDDNGSKAEKQLRKEEFTSKAEKQQKQVYQEAGKGREQQEQTSGRENKMGRFENRPT